MTPGATRARGAVGVLGAVMQLVTATDSRIEAVSQASVELYGAGLDALGSLSRWHPKRVPVHVEVEEETSTALLPPPPSSIATGR